MAKGPFWKTSCWIKHISIPTLCGLLTVHAPSKKSFTGNYRWRRLIKLKNNISPMSVTVSLLCVCDSSPSSFSDSESCRDSLVLLRLPARRMEDREPPFFTRKLRAPLIWSSREPPIRILRMGAGEDGSGERSSKLFIIIISRQGGLVCATPDLTLSLLGLLVIAGGVWLQSVAAAVEWIMSIFIIKDARKADLPLIAMAAELRVQAQAAAVQILQVFHMFPVKLILYNFHSCSLSMSYCCLHLQIQHL